MAKRRGLSQKRTDVDAIKSDLGGLSGFVEYFFRAFKDFFHILLMLPLYLFGFGIVGLASTPGLWQFRQVFLFTRDWPLAGRLFALGTSVALAYFLYGMSLLVIIPAFNSLFRLRLKAWRGPYYSLATIPWYIHNGMTYLLRYTFLEFVTPTPFNILFYKAMGMKIGKGTVINTSHISDPSLISLGEKVTIGGSVTIVGHYGQGGFLVLAPIEIGNRVTIGLKSLIMGGSKIGDEAKILPHSVVMPKTVIKDGEIWGGVPAVKIDSKEVLFKDRKSKKSA